MPCIPLTDKNRRIGFICVPNEPIRLMRGVWMEWHSYLGPSFYSDFDCQKPISDWWTRRRLVEKFNGWLTQNPNK